jgi:hypothetical protein
LIFFFFSFFFFFFLPFFKKMSTEGYDGEGVSVLLFPPRDSGRRPPRGTGAGHSTSEEAKAEARAVVARDAAHATHNIATPDMCEAADLFAHGERALWITRSTQEFRVLSETLTRPGASCLEIGCSYGEASARILSRTAAGPDSAAGGGGESEHVDVPAAAATMTGTAVDGQAPGAPTQSTTEQQRPFFLGVDNSEHCIAHCVATVLPAAAAADPARSVRFERLNVLTDKRVLLAHASRADLVAIDIGGDRAKLTISNIVPLLCAACPIVVVKNEELFDDARAAAVEGDRVVVRTLHGTSRHRGLVWAAALLSGGARWFDDMRARMLRDFVAGVPDAHRPVTDEKDESRLGSIVVANTAAGSGTGAAGSGNVDAPSSKSEQRAAAEEAAKHRRMIAQMYFGSATELRALTTEAGLDLGQHPFGHPLNIGYTPSEVDGRACCRFHNYSQRCKPDDCSQNHTHCHLCHAEGHRALDCDAFATPPLAGVRK